MKEFLQVLKRFLPPYKKYLALTIVFNMLSALLNIFSFAALIPILQILFRTEGTGTATQLMPWSFDNLKDVISNNADYYVTQLIHSVGSTTTLLLIGLFLAFTTMLKTGAYFLSSATIIPMRTGIVRDIRNQLYRKITSLPLGFFSDERKGDIIARMTGEPDTHHLLLLGTAVHIVAAHTLHPYIRAHIRLVYGSGRTQAQAELHQGAKSVERHHVAG